MNVRDSPDGALLRRFQHDPSGAWDEFLDRHADAMFRSVQRLRFDYDDAMDCFTYICEKLAENGFRRLRTIRHTGTSGDLTPWLEQVIKRFSISWIWSRDGRNRMLKPITRLSSRDQRVFDLHFRAGLSPLAIHERLRVELHERVELGEVFGALERIHAVLSPTKRWRLLSNLARSRSPLSLDELREDEQAPYEPTDPEANPEIRAIERETEARVQGWIGHLQPRHRLMVQLRYEDGLEIQEIGDLLHLTEREVRDCLAAVGETLRQAMNLSVGER